MGGPLCIRRRRTDMSKLWISLLSMAQIRQPRTRMGGPLCIWRRRMDMLTLCISLLSMAQIRQPRTRMGGPLCIWRRRTDMSKLCISLLSMAQIQQPSKDGRTPLHQASLNGHVEIVDFLVEHGADPTAQDKDGRT